MALRLRIPGNARLTRILLHPLGRAALLVCLSLGVTTLAGFTYYYVKFARLIDAKLQIGPFQSAAMIFAAPRTVSLEDQMSLEEVVGQLHRSGYTEARGNRLGWYHLRPDAVEIFPGPDSYFDQEGGVIRITGGRVSQIISTRDNTERTQYMLEPELLTNMYQAVGPRREKRRAVKFADLPPALVHAVLSAEDKRFFQHAGFDPFRVLKAAYVDLKEGRIAEGASTLTMQLAGTIWLDRSQRTWKRKAAEVLITLHLEQKLSKEQIFEYYANHIDLGMRGSFSIRGFGEAAQAYFGKDVRDLTVAEAAVLAGIIQRPSWTNPVKNPERARQRRNIVLALMRDNRYITDAQYTEALASPLTITKGGAESADAPYFVDLVNNQLRGRIPGPRFSAQFLPHLHHSRHGPAAGCLRGRAPRHVEGGRSTQETARLPQRKGPRCPGRADRPRHEDRRNPGGRGRPQLRHEPVEPRAGQASAGFFVQALRVRGSPLDRPRRRPQTDHFPDHRSGPTHYFLL